MKYSRSKLAKMSRLRRTGILLKRQKSLSRGCARQSFKKYSSRRSPPYPANNCWGEIKKGNDGMKYKSVGNKQGTYRWVKLSQHKQM
jgi:hypothetical protein